MDKATLSKKSVLALERLAKKVGAKTVTPEGKRKNKTQLINSVIIAERLGKKNPALKSKKTLGAKPKLSFGAGKRIALIKKRDTLKTQLAALNKMIKELPKK